LVIIALLVRHDTPSVIMALVLMLVGVIAIRTAVGAPPNYSRLHAVLGWLLGFLVDAVILAVVFILWAVA
jgi:hypothetical protein